MTANTRKPLTILQVITQRRYSGAERMCIALSETLQRQGHRVVLACKPGELMLQAASDAGLEVHTPRISGKANLLAPLRIATLAREVGADVIHTHLSTASLWGAPAGRLARVPVLSHVHALNSARFYRRADLVVTCSRGVRSHLLSQGMDPDKVRVVYYGIDMRRFDGIPEPDLIRKSLNIPPDAPTVGCVAHLSPKKGQGTLLRAVAALSARCPRLHCLLVGEGIMTDDLTKLAWELGIADRVHLLGYRPDAVAVMSAMDVLVLPSLAKEGLGLVLVEAALLGKPTLGSDAPGIDEALEDNETGFLFPPGDADALAQRIDLLLGDAELRHRMGAEGRRRALRLFTLDAMANQMTDIYDELLGGQRRGSARA